VLLGGADADRFVYDATGWGVDVIMDWTDGVDRLVFDGVTEVQGIADLAPAQSGANTVLSLGDDRIILAGAAFATVTDADLLII
jgi:Ca2+-binding RTX toxin-like protein